MTDANPPKINRRRMLSITVTTAAGLAAGALASEAPAQTAPDLCDLPGTGSVDSCGPLDATAVCGSVNDKGDHNELWLGVQDATPAYPSPNDRVVVFSGIKMDPWQRVPNPTPPPPTPKPPQPQGDAEQGYAIRGGTKGQTKDFDNLFIPLQRTSGIECKWIWQKTTINYWKWAYAEAVKKSGHATALGINSVAARHENQLHIHLSQLNSTAVKNLATAQQAGHIATTPPGWAAITRVDLLNNGKEYRVLHVPDLETNLFGLLRSHIAKSDKAMATQMLVVTPAPTGGFHVINSQHDMAHGTGECDALLHYS
jgi:CDP-diacylglycerol pyrophosphatase